MRLGVAGALVDGELVAGDVEVAGAQVAAVGLAPAGARGLAVPGLVDLQVNGFGGADFLAADAAGYRRAGEAMAGTGVTAYQPTLITSPLETYEAALAEARAAANTTGGPRILGVHLEGPFLSPERVGAHDPEHLRAPDDALARRLEAMGPVTAWTVAPELPGAEELVAALAGRGLLVSLGHSDADAAAAHRGFDRGARTVTHLFNAMRRGSPREPGLAEVALARRDVTVRAIVDGIHLAAETTRVAYAAARGRFALITDAVAAAGLGDGSYALGDRRVHVSDGEARLADGTLAGSVLTLDRAVRNLAGLGVGEVEAVEAATAVPARLVGRDDLATLRPGTPADVAVLDDRFEVATTFVDGIAIV